MRTRFIESILLIDAVQWNAVAGVDYPFLQHAFLAALEMSGSVCARSGWQPQHLLVEDDSGYLLAILPLYLKSHSYGEYVFDWEWAEAYRRHNLDYFPKLLSAIPFTPATGPRLAFRDVDAHSLIAVVADALEKQSHMLGASGWHCLFPPPSEDALWQTTDAQLRLGCQFHWKNYQFNTFDDFLALFTSRKRKELKRERRIVAESGIQLQRLTGHAITLEHWQQFYRFYQMTYLKRSGHGGYLTQEFFNQLHNSFRHQLLLVMAYDGDMAIAGALIFFSSTTLYGRYWGAVRDVPGLHFEACYYQGIEFCIERQLQFFDPGAQGEHKITRGFEPVLTHSYHRIHHPEFRQAIGDFLQREQGAVKQYQQACAECLPFKVTPAC